MAKPSPNESEIAGKLEELNKKVATAAEDVVFRIFPQKILQLAETIETMNETSSPYNRSYMYTTTDTTVYPPLSPKIATHPTNAPDTKKRKRVDGEEDGSKLGETDARYLNLVVANHHVKKVQDEVRKESEDLVELCDKVKLWVSLTMPKIEDGDNFGVQIQEEVLSELHRSQESGYNLRDDARTNHLNRAKICAKLIKYPNVEDYALGLQEHDAKQLYMARQHLVDIKNIYSVLTDIIHKNIQKIRAPRGNNRVSLY